MKLTALPKIALAASLPFITLLSYADDSYPANVYWGDTHVHTSLSVDSYMFNNQLTPDDAYRFAQGEVVRSQGNKLLKRSRPLDFLMVADHAENIGVLPALEKADPILLQTEVGKQWYGKYSDFLAAIRKKDWPMLNKWREHFQDILPDEKKAYYKNFSIRNKVLGFEI